METDILLKSIQVQSDECSICYENKQVGFRCDTCAWEHCIDCHKKWLKEGKNCPQCRKELIVSSDDDMEDEEEEEEISFCTKAMYLLLLHGVFAFMLVYIFFILIMAGDMTLYCEDDVWCFLSNLLMFVFVVTCCVQTFVKLATHYRL